jgi:hypothetical protein
LKSSSVEKNVSKGQKINLSLEIQNEGFATPYNPRPVQLALRNQQTRKVYKQTLNTNIQTWYTGKVIINEQVELPTGLPKGIYELLLVIPDAAETLKNRSEYSIRLANERIWEDVTGFNRLDQVLVVR